MISVKKIVCIFLSMLFLILLAACGSDSATAPQSGNEGTTSAENQGGTAGEVTASDKQMMLDFIKTGLNAKTAEDLRACYTEDTPDAELEEIVSHSPEQAFEWDRDPDVEMEHLGTFEGYTVYKVKISWQEETENTLQPSATTVIGPSAVPVKVQEGRFVTCGKPDFTARFEDCYAFCRKCMGEGERSVPCQACLSGEVVMPEEGDIVIPIEGVASYRVNPSVEYTEIMPEQNVEVVEGTVPEQRFEIVEGTLPEDYYVIEGVPGSVVLPPDYEVEQEHTHEHVHEDVYTDHNHDSSTLIGGTGCSACRYTGWTAVPCEECDGIGFIIKK